ncbi:permease prefix domain 1-containing protein [Agrococcus sp. ARC_14]|uniref:permease prefix domain 1-containing protein n=1 Tax=Agrococcus sp. ARC_14 TaxID=2919927 RepID=UPI001F065838|nr:permease prefix domain 1-containing protein [Agrococcus sp. ARC_14]MCH1882448.1 permease prefix domain 1-containing protein [Agrococcus sp. ARC_14]
MPAPDPITDLVGRLERAVVATGRRRRELAREIEGDLREDLAARIQAGAPAHAAAASVVAEFGDPRALAAELSIELLAARGRRYAVRTAAAAVTLVAAWVIGMTTLVGLGFRVRAEDEWMLQVSHALDVAGPLVVGAAVLGWIAIRRWGSLAALATVAALQLGFAVVLVAGALAMAVAGAVPAAGTAVLVVLVTLTVLLGTGLAASSAGVLLGWGAIRLEPLRARS